MLVAAMILFWESIAKGTVKRILEQRCCIGFVDDIRSAQLGTKDGHGIFNERLPTPEISLLSPPLLLSRRTALIDSISLRWWPREGTDVLGSPV